MTTISLSRFLLSLRDVAYRSNVLTPSEGSLSRSHVSTLEFSRNQPLENVLDREMSGLEDETQDENIITEAGSIHNMLATDITHPEV